MYFINGYIFILLNLCPSIPGTDDYNLLESSKQFPQRMLHLMENYVARGRNRIDDILYIRSQYEVSPHFEYGYVLSEIMEWFSSFDYTIVTNKSNFEKYLLLNYFSYRKMVGTIKRPVIFKSDAVFDTIKRTELVQKLFLDILHLVYMANEIPPKYSYIKEFDLVRVDMNDSMSAIEENRKYREWIKKKHHKEMKKRTALIKKGQIRHLPRVVKRPNKWWPIDYGWEIDYQW